MPGDLGRRHGTDASIAFAALTLMAFNAGGRADTATGRTACQGGSGAFTLKLHLELPESGEDVEDQSPLALAVAVFR